jgi:hypothetical protein
MMRAAVAAVVAATLFTGSALASDPFNGNGWQRSRPPAAVAYFKYQLQPSAADRAAYGLAITAPTPRRYSAAPLLLADAPKLADLRFNGVRPQTLRFSNQLAWSMNAEDYANEERHNLLGIPGVGGMIFGLALAAGAIYGGYTLLKKECPAINTTTGACIDD